ncbi:pentapeptide repeat-containing protein [Sinorhizobium fredii]|uniref:pentapeptide repeat-containing protein n=1 Tax=Rhizobium fredii TaxID=380 RepID=UPI00059E6379|nr:pentapeptide repeat-containing protein [Sinorhizobium fredii]
MTDNDSEAEWALKSANENVYYCLATLHGEPESGRLGDLLDRNRNEWQRWLEAGIHNGSAAVRGELTSLLRSRMGNANVELPDSARPADFSDTIFERRLFLGGYKFPAGARFDRSVFERGIDATKASFDEDLSLVSAKIKVRGNFRGETFNYVNLDNLEVEGQLGFAGEVRGEFSMRECTVSGDTVFSHMYFNSHVYFGSARLGRVRFVEPKFSESADFAHAEFAGDVDFINAMFHSGSVFIDAVFGASAEFRGTAFKDRAWFDRTEWRGARVSFTNVRFEAGGRFRGATFVKCVPDFRGAVLHEATELDGVTWPAIFNKGTDQQANLYAYERLKLEMERLKKHEDEQFFFRQELRVRRALMKPWSPGWLLNSAYEKVSGYGESIMRPLVGMGALAAAGFVGLTLLPVSSKMSPSSGMAAIPLPCGSAAQLSLLNLLSFLPMRREAIDALALNDLQFNWIFRAISAVEALGGAVLLFLLALALKNRFRMR